MARKVVLLIVLGLAGYVLAAGVPGRATSAPETGASLGWFSLRGTVVRVVDGDTVHVRVGRRLEKVRLIGIDAAEQGNCFASEAARELRRLALNKVVRLRGDRSQARRDAYKRLLAYMHLPSGRDVAVDLLRGGYVVAYVFAGRPFARVAQYQALDDEAAAQGVGAWRACSGPSETAPTTTAPTTTTTPAIIVVPPPTTTTPPRGNCDASYPTVCIPPPPPDLDCRDVPHRSFRVLQPDPHRFDGNRDGVGCES